MRQNKNNFVSLYVPHVRGSSLLSEHWATPSHLSLWLIHLPSAQRMLIFPQEPTTHHKCRTSILEIINKKDIMIV